MPSSRNSYTSSNGYGGSSSTSRSTSSESARIRDELNKDAKYSSHCSSRTTFHDSTDENPPKSSKNSATLIVPKSKYSKTLAHNKRDKSRSREESKSYSSGPSKEDDMRYWKESSLSGEKKKGRSGDGSTKDADDRYWRGSSSSYR